MYIQHGTLMYSPSDLTLFMESPFASWMEHLAIVAPDQIPERDPGDGMMAMLQEKGGEHEKAVLEAFIAQGLNVADISSSPDKETATVTAMESGAEVIFQACLSRGAFKGFADFLVKVPGESRLGEYHYEVWDTKLSKTLKPYFTVQLCCYEDLLEGIQGRRSQDFVVVLGDGQRERLRTDDYF
jgi:uncharacterized protein